MKQITALPIAAALIAAFPHCADAHHFGRYASPPVHFQGKWHKPKFSLRKLIKIKRNP